MSEEWTFAVDRGKTIRDITPLDPSILDRIVNESINSNEAKRQRYERILNNLLDTIMMTEMAARADGFDIKVFTHTDNGKITFGSDGAYHTITAYGVHVYKHRK